MRLHYYAAAIGLIVFMISACSSTVHTHRNAHYREPSENSWHHRTQRVINIRAYNALYESIDVKNKILQKWHSGRSGRYMEPKYITIHSTQNVSIGSGAMQHAKAFKNNPSKAKSWHFSVDQDIAVQHLPDNEQANHAENWGAGRGQGNQTSIGIEMCEDLGNSIPMTIDKTARLTAFLMHRHQIPLSNVVPHYHWPRKEGGHKFCPRILLEEDGKPGQKWRQFQRQVDHYYQNVFMVPHH